MTDTYGFPRGSATPWDSDPVAPPRDAPPWAQEPVTPPKTETLGEVLTGPNRYQTWPERFVRETAGTIKDVVLAPGEAVAGTLDPRSDEMIRRAAEGALLLSPASPGYRLGMRYGAPPRPPGTPGEQAAATSGALGAPLPGGYSTDSALRQAMTQATRALPIVGSMIDQRVAATRRAAGERVGEIAATLGNAERGVLGANMRTAIDDLVESNRSVIDSAYSNVRSVIDPELTVPARNTAAVYQEIVRRRAAARQEDPEAGLGQVANIAREGISFNGLIRAKNDLAQLTDFNAPIGFTNADRKQIGAAMKRDLHEIAAAATQPGRLREQTLYHLRQAEGEAARMIELNKRLTNLTGRDTGEGLAGVLLSAGREKTGDVQLLAQLRNALPREQFNHIAGSTLQELGYSPATNAFSLDRFATGWSNLSQAGKAVLFEPQHRRFLDDIAQLGTHMKQAEQYMNRSGTARPTALVALLGAAGHAAWVGDLSTLLGFATSVGGAGGLGYMLARPSGSAAAARFARAAMNYDRQPSLATLATLRLATKSAIEQMTGPEHLSPAEMVQTTFPNRPTGPRDIWPATPGPTQERPLPYNPNFL